jgi:uncharacterized protein (TIGR02284 family)
MNALRDPVVPTLNELISTCLDGVHGYKAASRDVESVDLKSIFDDCADQRAQFAEDLERKVIERGGVPTTNGTFAGAMQRGWMTLKCGFVGDCEHTVLEECDRGDHTALERYEQALGLELPSDVRELLETQREQIHQTQQQIHSLAAASSV